MQRTTSVVDVLTLQPLPHNRGHTRLSTCVTYYTCRWAAGNVTHGQRRRCRTCICHLHQRLYFTCAQSHTYLKHGKVYLDSQSTRQRDNRPWHRMYQSLQVLTLFCEYHNLLRCAKTYENLLQHVHLTTADVKHLLIVAVAMGSERTVIG